jgi:stage II sporulation protein D
MRKWLQIVLAANLAVGLLQCLACILAPDKREPVPSGVQDPPNSTIATRTEARVMVISDSNAVDMSLNEYLTGVLLAEIPCDFHEEAKKAQAIVARTYTLRVANLGIKHGDGTVCGDHTCCQEYISPDDYLNNGGDQFAIDQMKKAVEETEGIVLTYGGDLIDATYFSCSGGVTEDAVAVWGADIPYLRSVSSPGEEIAAHYIDTVRFSSEEFQKAIGLKLTGEPKEWFGNVSYTDGGGVDTLEIGDRVFSGTKLRADLGLYSTWFSLLPLSDGVLITTRGFGHRVGMSQYGAEAMARMGKTYDEILQHYYRGVTIETG